MQVLVSFNRTSLAPVGLCVGVMSQSHQLFTGYFSFDVSFQIKLNLIWFGQLHLE